MQNRHGWLIEPQTQVRYYYDKELTGEAYALGPENDVYIKWDDGIDHGWYDIDDFEPVEAP